MSQRLQLVDFIFITFVRCEKNANCRRERAGEIVKLTLIILLLVQLAWPVLKPYRSFSE